MRARLLATIASVLLVSGCAAGGVNAGDAGGGDAGGGEATSQGSGVTESFDSPDPEPTTPETADVPPTKDNPAISVARLPIGGDSQDDDSDARLQCAHVTWIASEDGQIPKGTGVEITGIVFDPAAFEAVGDGCGSGRPSCLQYIFRSTALQCDLAVRATADVPQDANPSLGFSGLVFCPDNDSAACRRFVGALAEEQQLSVSLNVPQVPEPTEGPGPTESTGDTSTTDGG